LNIGDSVINISNGEQMIINEIGFDGSCICYIGKKMVGIFQPNEIATIEEYSNYKKWNNEHLENSVDGCVVVGIPHAYCTREWFTIQCERIQVSWGCVDCL